MRNAVWLLLVTGVSALTMTAAACTAAMACALGDGAAAVGAGARAGFELLRQVRYPHHRGRHLLPRLRSPNGVPEILTEIPTDITDLR